MKNNQQKLQKGATLMAAGTSSPELFAALVAVFSPIDDIGTGTIVGSGSFFYFLYFSILNRPYFYYSFYLLFN